MKSHFKKYASHRRSERGVTMLLVAVGMTFMILAIAALAIDLTALYSARNDARLAADAAALAGARVAANSGITSDTSVPPLTVSALAIQVATAVAIQNKVGGRALLPAEVSVNPSNAIQGSPRISVTVQRTDLPTFFARIWGNSVLPVSATAVAEVYNPSGKSIPVQPQCVKPWLLPNNAYVGGNLIDTATGAVKTNPGLVGKPISVLFGCNDTGCINGISAPPKFYPVVLPPPNASELPATCALGSCAYEQNIGSCSPEPLACGTTSSLVLDNNTGCGSPFSSMTNSGTSCLVHSTGNPTLGAGQDCFSTDAATSCSSASAFPLAAQFVAGLNNPLVKDSLANLGDLISNSSSLVTIPVYDSTGNMPPLAAPAPINVIGFVQGFIKDVTFAGRLEIYIVNVAGCAPIPSGSPVLGDGVSPVPVHLIAY